VVERGFKAMKLDPFGKAQGFIHEDELDLAYEILRTLREELPRGTLLLVDVHARFTETEALRAARRMAPLGIYWWEEPTTRDRQEAVHSVAAASPIPVATGEMYDTVGQFFTLAEGGGVNIFQPEPMSLGGIMNTLAVANLALAHGSAIAPHQSGGPIATAVCLQLAACVPNFLIQEHFDAFNEPWTRDLVTWHPSIDSANGHLSLPEGPGLGIDFDVGIALEHPYDPDAYLNIYEEGGWEKRIGSRGCTETAI
jgi:galactonate dehydratase